MKVGTVVAMYSHHTRARERQQAIADFARAECPVAHVEIQDRAPSPQAGRRTATLALRKACEVAALADAVAVLLIEDDVIPAATLPEWLSYLEANEDRVVTLYVPEVLVSRTYPGDLRRAGYGRGKRPESRIATLCNLRQWWGAQALWLPLPIAQAIADDRRFAIFERGLGPWDVALAAALHERGSTMGVAVPNVVQHRGPRNLVNPRRQAHSSASFVRDAPAPATERRA